MHRHPSLESPRYVGSCGVLIWTRLDKYIQVRYKDIQVPYRGTSRARQLISSYLHPPFVFFPMMEVADSNFQTTLRLSGRRDGVGFRKWSAQDKSAALKKNSEMSEVGSQSILGGSLCIRELKRWSLQGTLESTGRLR